MRLSSDYKGTGHSPAFALSFCFPLFSRCAVLYDYCAFLSKTCMNLFNSYSIGSLFYYALTYRLCSSNSEEGTGSTIRWERHS